MRHLTLTAALCATAALPAHAGGFAPPAEAPPLVVLEPREPADIPWAAIAIGGVLLACATGVICDTGGGGGGDPGTVGPPPDTGNPGVICLRAPLPAMARLLEGVATDDVHRVNGC